MNMKVLKLYVRISTECRSFCADDEGVISTETAIVGAVVLAAAVAVAAKFSGLFDQAVKKIPETIDS